ncbi:MAG: hypothetical protein GY832_40000 [Chloroflexi bacterium]|nr:hypothetical protein [Chloroflexota bacterium]
MHHLGRPGEDGEGADWGALAAEAMGHGDRACGNLWIPLLFLLTLLRTITTPKPHPRRIPSSLARGSSPGFLTGKKRCHPRDRSSVSAVASEGARANGGCFCWRG